VAAMNPFSAFLNLVGGVFLTGQQASQEREQQGPQGRAYDKWLDEHGYEAQYQAWVKTHGSPDGFVYQDPGDAPGGE
jgi:hypothetical protein